ncbi:hypothetical protein ACFQI3_06555 [Hansschlegelia quercus]|uniref:Uncharacterized protein n=1 Tax=Hansschlegelia quercus TaxID=2528245 RepID=A0A4Q9GQ60_9HYPH|nr:hypothetical protein [Hansschlegelia quercus]TBN53787.1 hypothetical protein EYR15_08285 [Hansschlegelia quercus]
MKLFALGLAAATSVAAALAATPASAGGVYIGVDDGYGYYHRPPPPPIYRPRPYYAAPRPVYYDAPPRRSYYVDERPARRCKIRVERDWGRYGPVTKRVEVCDDRW